MFRHFVCLYDFSMFWKISYVYENYVWVNIPFYLCFKGFTMFHRVVSRGVFFLIANTCSWDICLFQVYHLLLRKMMKSLYPMPLKCHHYLHPFIKFNNGFINQRIDGPRFFWNDYEHKWTSQKPCQYIIFDLKMLPSQCKRYQMG